MDDLGDYDVVNYCYFYVGFVVEFVGNVMVSVVLEFGSWVLILVGIVGLGVIVCCC